MPLHHYSMDVNDTRNNDHVLKQLSPLNSLHNRLVLKCGLAHLNANAIDESNANVNANAQHLNQMQMRSS